jgi:lipopolysaccharide export system permease protein
MGINLAFGIITAFTFVFFDKFFAVMVNKSNLSPILGAWIPNFVFLILALYFLKNAKK